MKKFLVVAVVLAVACLSSVAFAADITLSGELAVRSRMFENLDLNKNIGDHQTYTQTRMLLEANVKASDTIKGKMALWNDFDTWDTNDVSNKNQKGYSLATAAIREGWIDFMVPDMPVGVKAGHMLTSLNNGWFFRSLYSGSDAWLVYMPMGKNLIAFQNTKVKEGVLTTNADDVDCYSLVGVMTLSDAMKVGADLTMLRDNFGAALLTNTGSGRLYNLGLNFIGKVGPANLKAEVDIQSGTAKNTAGDRKYKGNQFVVMGTVPMDALTLNATLARGTGNKVGATTKQDVMVTLLDKAGPKYTLIYDYLLKTAAGLTAQGFANTTAIEVGAMIKVAKSVEVGADLWYLRATEKVALNGGSPSTDLGTELDVKANWALAQNLSWNWTIGYFTPGKAYETAAGVKDAAYAFNGILSLKF
jgi:hypothetical protein